MLSSTKILSKPVFDVLELAYEGIIQLLCFFSEFCFLLNIFWLLQLSLDEMVHRFSGCVAKDLGFFGGKRLKFKEVILVLIDVEKCEAIISSLSPFFLKVIF